MPSAVVIVAAVFAGAWLGAVCEASVRHWARALWMLRLPWVRALVRDAYCALRGPLPPFDPTTQRLAGPRMTAPVAAFYAVRFAGDA